MYRVVGERIKTDGSSNMSSLYAIDHKLNGVHTMLASMRQHLQEVEERVNLLVATPVATAAAAATAVAVATYDIPFSEPIMTRKMCNELLSYPDFNQHIDAMIAARTDALTLTSLAAAVAAVDTKKRVVKKKLAFATPSPLTMNLEDDDN